MNISILNKNLYYRSFNIFKDPLLERFCENYLKNNNEHKYELFYYYVFSIDSLTERVKEYLQCIDDTNYVYSIYLHRCNSSKYIINGKLNFECQDILNFCKSAIHLCVGEFLWNNEICTLFLSINRDNEIYGFAIDNNSGDGYFKNFEKLNLFESKLNLNYDSDDELINNITKLQIGI